MTETGQIRQDKAIFHTVRMRSRGMGRCGTPRFQSKGNALTATHYDELERRNNQAKTPLRSQEYY